MLLRTILYKSVLLQVIYIFPNHAWLLSSPRDVTIKSINMRNVLQWRPQQSTCSMYSVQFQGEFERVFLNDSWETVPECQQITQTECDLTVELSSDSDYNVRVRAECGHRVSPWAKLGIPFNRRDTILTVPDMTVVAMGDSLLVTFKDLPLTGGVTVTVWRREEEHRTWTEVLPVEKSQLHIDSLEEGAVYCIRAQTHMDSHSRSSRSTETQCVTITGPSAPWLKPTIASIAVVILAGLVFALFWAIVHCNPEACQAYFHKEPLPTSLQMDCSTTGSKLHPDKDNLSEPIHTVLLIGRPPLLTENWECS